MSYPDLPPAVKAMLAEKRRRERHSWWHRGRSNLPLTESWRAPRKQGEAGSGIDFLGMHRRMIAVVDDALAAVNDPNWPRVEGWNPIPWFDKDPDCPVPGWQDDPPRWADPEDWKRYTQSVKIARSPEQIAVMQKHAKNFVDPNYLGKMSLDDLGIAMENTIHGWMHVRWSGLPPNDPNSAGVNNDWLFSAWSSHVNKTFWKLHGWIDDRIGNWEAATGKTADFSKAWIGPVNTSKREIVLPAAVHRNLKAMD